MSKDLECNDSWTTFAKPKAFDLINFQTITKGLFQAWCPYVKICQAPWSSTWTFSKHVVLMVEFVKHLDQALGLLQAYYPYVRVCQALDQTLGPF